MWLIPNWSPITAPPPSPTERRNNGGTGVRGRRGVTSHSWQGVNFPECSICLQYMTATRTRRYRPAKLFVLVVRFHRCLSPSENLCRHLGYQEQLNPPPPPPPQNCLLAQPRRYVIGEPHLSRLPAFEKERKRNPSANRSRTHTGVCWTNSVGVCSNLAGIPCSDPWSSASSPRLVI